MEKFTRSQIARIYRQAHDLVDDGSNEEYIKGISDLLAEIDPITGMPMSDRSEEIQAAITMDPHGVGFVLNKIEASIRDLAVTDDVLEQILGLCEKYLKDHIVNHKFEFNMFRDRFAGVTKDGFMVLTCNDPDVFQKMLQVTSGRVDGWSIFYGTGDPITGDYCVLMDMNAVVQKAVHQITSKSIKS